MRTFLNLPIAVFSGRRRGRNPRRGFAFLSPRRGNLSTTLRMYTATRAPAWHPDSDDGPVYRYWVTDDYLIPVPELPAHLGGPPEAA